MERCDQRASLAAPGPTETVVSGLGFLYAASILQDGCNNSGQHWERGGPPAGPGPSPPAVHLLRAVNRASQISTNPPGSAGRRVQGRKSPAETNLAAAPRRSRPALKRFELLVATAGFISQHLKLGQAAAAAAAAASTPPPASLAACRLSSRRAPCRARGREPRLLRRPRADLRPVPAPVRHLQRPPTAQDGAPDCRRARWARPGRSARPPAAAGSGAQRRPGFR